MKKNILLPLILNILIIAGGGLYYYYYQYVETVTEFYKIVYTPPREVTSIFGEKKYSDPKIEIESIRVYENDSLAIIDQERDKQSTIKFLEEKLEEVAHKKASDAVEKISIKAERDVIENMLSEWWIIVRVTHTRNFDKEKIKEIMKFWNRPEKVEEFNKKHKISVGIYPIY